MCVCVGFTPSYPGRSDFDSSTPGVDGNCNGIYGVDTDGMSYEDK